ncbi:unnamed protein product [Aphis gossypii]|uniref:Uncharacterized protein n=1 Tax=Aphis gossypii TaxID=80765 RepID=A0A9P0IU86_APHGO|nr:unnamed protein product [Aphis gossypii]
MIYSACFRIIRTDGASCTRTTNDTNTSPRSSSTICRYRDRVQTRPHSIHHRSWSSCTTMVPTTMTTGRSRSMAPTVIAKPPVISVPTTKSIGLHRIPKLTAFMRLPRPRYRMSSTTTMTTTVITSLPGKSGKTTFFDLLPPTMRGIFTNHHEVPIILQ